MCKLGYLSEEDIVSSQYLPPTPPTKTPGLCPRIPDRGVCALIRIVRFGSLLLTPLDIPFGIPKRGGVHLGRSFPDARGMMSAIGSCVRSRAGGTSAGLGLMGLYVCAPNKIKKTKEKLNKRKTKQNERKI